jgi:integrative and conjugative element protein (TIGR02256 family)
VSKILRWTANNGEYQLLITETAWNTFETECNKAERIETGGILIGYYYDDKSTAVITDATPPPVDSVSGTSWFQRGISGLKKLLFERWLNKDQRQYYLGEWHYHPTTLLEPSSMDLNQMSLINQTIEYHCKQPIMILLGERLTGTRQIRVYIFPFGRQPQEFHKLWFNENLEI